MAVVMTTEAARTIRSADTFQADFKKNSDASVGIVLLRTREAGRAHIALQDIAIEKEIPFKLWACNKGWQSFPDPKEGRDDIDVNKAISHDDSTIDAGKALDYLCKSTVREGIYVMHHVHPHFEKPLIQQYLKDFLVKSRETEVRLVLIVPETVKIPAELEDDLHVMDFRPPSHAELHECYTQVMDSIQENVRPEFSEDQINVIVQNAVGMTWLEFETALALAIVEIQEKLSTKGDKTKHPEDYTAVILRHKTEAIKKSDMLELIPSEPMENVGGFDLLKGWLTKRASAYSNEAKLYGIKKPKGALCVGPPGAGKSLLAKAVSSTMLVPLVKFDIGKVFARFVGESEGRVNSALRMIESMSPCVLLVDEMDKAFAGLQGGGSDGGIGSRVLGTFLNWMQERDNDKYPVFIIATANNVTGLPPELMRKGRLDEIFFCSFPSVEERVEIMKIHLHKRGHMLKDAELMRVAEATDQYVGSELEAIIEGSLLEAFNKDLPHPTVEIMLAEAAGMQPLSKTFADRVQAMHDWAKQHAKPASSGSMFDGIAPPKKPAGLLRPGGIRTIKTVAKKGLDG